MIRWEGIREFVAVTETGSFTRASQQLGMSVAQVSRQVKELEQRLSTELIHRTTRKVSVTEAGALYYRHCRPLLDGVIEAERAVTYLQDKAIGQLKITAPITYGEERIMPLINDFALQHPQLNIECELTNQTLDLIEGGFDLAIRLGRLQDSSMKARRLASRKLYLCASREYLKQHGEPHSLSELQHHNCLLGTLEYWRFREDGCERNLRVNGTMRANSGRTLLDAAIKGVGLVQLPDYYVDQAIVSGHLTPLLSQFEPEREGIWALYPPSRHLSTKVRMLVDYLVDHIGETHSLPMKRIA